MAVLILNLACPFPIQRVEACCPAYALGQPVQIADQRILVAWEPDTKLEHFVREAGFKKPLVTSEVDGKVAPSGDNFGFLVPSPTRPTIEAADGGVFPRLAELSRPIVEHRSKWNLLPTAVVLWPFLLQNTAKFPVASAPDTASRSVELIESKQVAGYDVSVLKADDAGALTQWLEEHGYDSRSELKVWAEPYVAKGWLVTAFKYSSHSASPEVGAVRMSFETDRPIFPYRVPTDQIAESGQGNLLHTYVVGPGKAKGTLGEGDSATAWSQGLVTYAKPLGRSSDARLLFGAIPDSTFGNRLDLWLTSFEDRTWPSGTDDLWFDFEKNATPYQQVNIIEKDRQFIIPLDLIAFGGMATFIYFRRRSKKS